ncbi:MAG TPA: hypothetical protein PLQ45_04970 [Anaerohalosphaeraceae bacterium]|jgi:hypothetical protein|nr:hypothetical protein [Anaerohalosphaeraceae bacterium]
METCKYLRDCEFFNNPNTQQFQVLADQLKADYCQGRFADCARFQVAIRLGRDQVPATMLPTQLQWAELIFRQNEEASRNSRPDL